MIRAITLGLGLLLVALFSRTYVASVDAGIEWKPWRNGECRFQSLDKAAWTPREEYLTAVCATDKAGVSLPVFLAIGQCESGWNRFANNGGSYLGLFQHAAGAYVGRIHAYNPPAWDRGLSERWTNSRGQIVMSARMMSAVGTGPWGCA